MDGSKFESFNLTFMKPAIGQLTVGFRAKVRQGEDLVRTWEAVRAEIFADPTACGFALAAADDEDTNIGIQQRSIQSAIRLTAQKSGA